MGVGVNQAAAVKHHAHMAGPEHQVAARQGLGWGRRAQGLLLI